MKILQAVFTAAVLVAMVSLAGCEKGATASRGEKAKVLDAYFKAFNDHNVDELVATTSNDIRLMSVTPDTVTIDLRGHDELRKWLTGYFQSLPNVQSAYNGLTAEGDYLSFVETATWGKEGEKKSQSSLATYLIKDGKIHRVWYYYPGE